MTFSRLMYWSTFIKHDPSFFKLNFTASVSDENPFEIAFIIANYEGKVAKITEQNDVDVMSSYRS